MIWVQKKGTEIALWALFLLACAGLGYFHGLKPDSRMLDFFSKPTSIRILTVSQLFFPPELIHQLERETHSSIQLIAIQNWNELNLKLIATQSPEILFIPAHWAQTLHQESLLNNEISFQRLATRELASDFRMPQNPQQQDFLPLFWSQLAIYTRPENQDINKKNNALGKTKPSRSQLGNTHIAVLADADLLLKFQGENSTGPEWEFLNFTDWLSHDVPDFTNTFLSTHVRAAQHPEWKLTENYSPIFYVFGFSLSRNSEHATVAARIIKEYLNQERQIELLARLPLGSSLSNINRLVAGQKEQKAGALRDLIMKDVQFLISKEKDSEIRAQELAPSFPITSGNPQGH